MNPVSLGESCVGYACESGREREVNQTALALVVAALEIGPLVWWAWMLRRRVEGLPRLLATLLAMATIAYMLLAPACFYLPRSPGSHPIERRVVGVDRSGRWYMLESTRRLALAWGFRWWFELNPHALPGEGGIEYVPPMRFATGPRMDWRLTTSEGTERVFNPPLDSWPGVSRSEQLTFLRPSILADGSLVLLQSSSILMLDISSGHWSSVTLKKASTAPSAVALTSAITSDGLAFDLANVREEGGGSTLDHTQDRLLVTVTDIRTGEVGISKALSLPGQRPHRANRYDLNLVSVEQGLLLFETFSEHGPGPGSGRAFWIARNLDSVRLLCAFEFERGERLAFSASSDGVLFTTGESVYRTDGERLRSTGPFSSSAWVGRTLIGIRRFPYFAERVKERERPLRPLLNALHNQEPPRGPAEWRGDRDVQLYVEVLDAREGPPKGGWLRGIDESGHADLVERVELE